MWIRRIALLGTLAALAVSASAQPAPGSYSYSRVNIAGLENTVEVTFHPDGSYALILEEDNRVHVLDWATRSVVTHDLTPTLGDLLWADVEFRPAGDFALLVGNETSTGMGVVYRFDDALSRSGGTTPQVFTEWTLARRSETFAALQTPTGGGNPSLLTRSSSSPWIVRLHEIDLTLQDLVATTATNATAGCSDLAFVDNAFDLPGRLVVCGLFAADSLYRTDLGGGEQWITNLGNSTHGNTYSAAARPDEGYGLVVDTSGRRLMRFEGGQLTDLASSLSFPTQAIFDVAFSPDGERALIVGRAGGSPLSAPIREYRHDLFSCTSPASCEVTDVSISNFDASPWSGTTSTLLRASAWQPSCDSGLIVGGESSAFSSTGIVIEFDLPGASCNTPAVVPAVGAVGAGALVAALASAGAIAARRGSRRSRR